ncbi:MAG: hypothetical protein HY707_08495 [Ignavibacteriae bacterium]|nr:hypothetical protein [Ignavibacteriota bacterium]
MKHFIAKLTVCILVLSVCSHSQVPQKISYQGLLTTSPGGAAVPNGSYDLKFEIFNAPTGGTSRHTETHTGVDVTRGTFSVVLGPLPPIFIESLYVEVTALSGPSIGSPLTFLPRSELTSAPYALAPWTINGGTISYSTGNVGISTDNPTEKLEVSGNAKITGTLFSSNVSSNSPLSLQTAGTTRMYIDDATGNVGIGMTNPVQKFEIVGANLGAATSGSAADGIARFRPSGSAAALDIGYLSSPAHAWIQSRDADNYTINYNLALNPNGGDIGIGTTTFGSLLTVGSPSIRGTLNVVGSTLLLPALSLTDSRANGHQYSIYGGLTGTGSLDIFDQNAAATRLTINSSGNVGIGTTTPVFKLQVETNDDFGRAVWGRATATSGVNYGVYGESKGSGGRGVYGVALASGGVNVGVWGQCTSASGFGVYCVGDCEITGDLTVSGSKAFHIDHPLDPANRYLNHYCAEGPQPLNIYRGNVVLDGAGEAWVELPKYFDAVNREVSYDLTPIGAAMPNLHIAQEVLSIAGATGFRIAGGKPLMKVCWTVAGVRNDPYLATHGAPVEPEKLPEHKGKYLHPELYGKPKEMGISYTPGIERLNARSDKEPITDNN